MQYRRPATRNYILLQILLLEGPHLQNLPACCNIFFLGSLNYLSK